MGELTETRGGLELVRLSQFDGLGADVVVTTRAGGVSKAPFDTLNLGNHVGDDPGAVAENRRRLAEAMGVDGSALVIATQVHGAGWAEVRRGVPAGAVDIIATRDDGIAICILVADCAPIVVLDPVTRLLVVAHAGWRGTAAGVARTAVAVAVHLGASPARCHAAIGPCISAATYQVGREVADALGAAGCAEAVLPDGTGRFLADLAAANAAQLESAGIPRSNVTTTPMSTDGGGRFFSDRAARPCGRFALAARLRDDAS